VPPNPVSQARRLRYCATLASMSASIGAFGAIVIGQLLVEADRRAGTLPLIGARPLNGAISPLGKMLALVIATAAMMPSPGHLGRNAADRAVTGRRTGGPASPRAVSCGWLGLHHDLRIPGAWGRCTHARHRERPDRRNCRLAGGHVRPARTDRERASDRGDQPGLDAREYACLGFLPSDVAGPGPVVAGRRLRMALGGSPGLPA
jgi:hypothetical protein